MTKLAMCLAGLFLTCVLGFCTREDGLPDPPVQVLVPCHPSAADDDPLACPAASDDLASAQSGVDAAPDQASDDLGSTQPGIDAAADQ